jgi:hypothetical protein
MYHVYRLLHIPCSAHIIQLVAKRLTKHPTVKPALDTMMGIIQKAAHQKEFRLKVASMAKEEGLPITLLKPNDTRWNSTLAAVERFVKLKKVIQFLEGDSIPLGCWDVLAGLMVLLQPLKEATDDCQADKATLITFYNAFVYMKNEMNTMKTNNHILKQAATAAIGYLNDSWDRYIDDKLHVIISILLYGKNAVYDADYIIESQEWLFSWSLLYFTGMGIHFPISR